MINKNQIEELAKHFEIDRFTLLREYLQLTFLSYLYREKKAVSIFFKGGTAIRLLFGSSRFSEDLDFSTKLNKKEIALILENVEKSMQNELPSIKIFSLYTGKRGIRFRLKYQSSDFKYPFVIRLDFNQVKKTQRIVVSPIVTRFPIIIFPLVSHLSEEEILAEKISALVTRAMGRDFFDVWFLLEKGVWVDWRLVSQKLKEVERGFSKESIAKKIKETSAKKLERDLSQFLPRSQRKIIGMLKEKLEQKLE